MPHPRRSLPTCWQDVRLPGARPGVALAVVFFYLIFAGLLGLFSSDRDFLWAALMFGAIPLTALPAIHAAMRLSNPVRLEALRSEFGIGGPEASAGTVERAAWRGFAGVLRGPFATFAFLAPIYFLVAILNERAAWSERLDTALIFLLDGAVNVPAAVALGTVAAGRRPGWAAVRAGVYSVLFTALRIALMILVITTVLEHSRASDGPLGPVRQLAYADLVLCGLAAAALSAAGLAQLRRRLLPLRLDKPMLLRRPAVGDAHGSLLTAEELTGAGLDVSAWSLLRWRFWRDPLLRAERRHMWSRRRLLILWLVLPLLMVAGVVLWPFAARYVLGPMLVPIYYTGGIFIYPVVEGLLRLPWACVPLLFMVAVIAGEKQGPVLESTLVTPLAPLRLVAAKFLGKAWHLVLALAVLAVVCHFLPLFFARGYKVGAEPWDPALLIPLSTEALNTAAYALMLGAVGTYFAARQRTLAGAAAASLAAALGLLLARALLFSFLRMGPWRYSGEDYLPYVTQAVSGSLAEAIAYLLVAGMFLAGAARHLALRRDE